MRWTMGARAAAVCVVVGSWMVACSGASSVGLGAGDAGTDGTTGSSSGGSSGGGSGGSSGAGSGGSSGSGSGSSSGGGSGGSSGSSSGSGSGSGSSSGSSSGGHTDAGGCTNLECQVHSCTGNTSTTITGKVLDPAGRNPLYNVVVYVPNSPGGALDPIPLGLNASSCSCSALYSGTPIATAVTGPDGTFTLPNAPDGVDIPLVVQIGKWRKEITVPAVTQCGTTAAGNISLPKNNTDGAYASLPNIAVSTGGADALECLLTRVGVDEGFFTGSPTGPGVHVFQGAGGYSTTNPASPSSPTSLWDSATDLQRYDVIMLSCEGAPTTGVTSATAALLAPYVSAGGRVFAEHYHYAFFVDPTLGTAYTQFPNVAGWTNIGAFGNDAPYAADITGVIETTLPNGNPFPEGVALEAWLGNVGALNTSGELVVPVANARDDALVTSANVATPWVQTDPSVTPAGTQYFSWDMPFGAPTNDAGVPQYCGRVVYTDMHVSGSSNDYLSNTVVPTGCVATNPLSPDEAAIEFILFDLSSCVVPVGFTPQPPGLQ